MPRAPRTTAWLVAAAIAAVQAIAYRHAMNPDGLSYLDVARAFVSGDLDTALNPHWGPLYPALLALAFTVVRPSIDAVIPLAHAVNFLVFVAAMAAFDFFLRELLAARDGGGREGGAHSGPAHSPPRAPPSRWAVVLFGYGVFVYAILSLIGLRLVTPDMCVAASVFAAAGLILRMCRRGPTLGAAALLGVVLALGYFAKSVMFVIGLAFIGGLLLVPAPRGRPWRAIAVAAAVFVALASLLIVPFSKKTGSLTFGTAGKLAYNWEVNRVPYTNWQGDATSRLEHPPRQIRSNPDVFEYTRHVTGTYPPWFDPAYWNAGARTPVRAGNQLRQLFESADFYVDLFLGGAGVLATLMALASMGRHLSLYLAVLLPSAAALALYVPVHIEARYVAPFAALLWLVPVATRERERGRLLILAAALLVLPVGFGAAVELWKQRGRSNPHAVLAKTLHRVGVQPGDLVANVGVVRGENFGASFEGYWAYLAGVRIVAEIPEQRDFICRERALVEPVLGELASVGARAVVTRAIPLPACQAGWQAIDGTDFYVRLLERR